VAVLPVVLAMSDADAALLAAWVRAGGVLVAVDWAQTAKYDQDFAPRPNTTASEGSGAEGKTAFCVLIFSQMQARICQDRLWTDVRKTQLSKTQHGAAARQAALAARSCRHFSTFCANYI